MMWWAGRIAVVLVAAGLAAGGVARAAPTEAEAAEARVHYAQASRAYDLAEYEAALGEFKEAYRITGDPAFLFNIAQCHRKLGHPADAITFYKTYLRRAPNTPHRPEVEKFIVDLDKDPAFRPASATPPPAGPAAAAPRRSGPHARPVAAAGATASATVALVAAPAQPAPETDRPVYARGWFWIVTGAVLAGAATTVILLTRSDSTATPGPFSCPDCVTTTPIGPR